MKFEDFKQDFYSRVGDCSLFDSGNINLIKLVLDGLKVNYAARGKVRVSIFKSQAAIRFRFLLYRLRAAIRKHVPVFSSDTLLKLSGRRFLAVDPGGRTTTIHGVAQSLYFGNIVPALGRHNVISVAEGNKNNAADNDLRLPNYDMELASRWAGINSGEYNTLGLLRNCYRQIASSGKFSPLEMQNIAIAFQQFFIQYRVWNRLLEYIRPEIAFVWPHYHREGCIYALKERGIRVIELQHGLIAPQDIFYALPKQTAAISKRALFADEIWVYGNFWKEQLLKGCGYNPDQIKIKGYFPVVPSVDESELKNFRNKYTGKRIIVVTTQTFLAEYFCQYISFLSEDLRKSFPDYVILVKLHPAERHSEYSSITELSNVEIVNKPLEFLFAIAELNISIYSTTLFDGLRFGVPGFAVWFDQCSDYLQFFKESGIVRVIQPGENPLRIQHSADAGKPVSYYYETFDPHKILE